MRKWEYAIVEPCSYEIKSYHEGLQKLGEDGWELVTIRQFKSNGDMLIFKRQKKDE